MGNSQRDGRGQSVIAAVGVGEEPDAVVVRAEGGDAREFVFPMEMRGRALDKFTLSVDYDADGEEGDA